MIASLTLKEKKVTLVLCDNDQRIAHREWTDDNDLLERFFPLLDKVMREHDVAFNDIEKFTLHTEIPQGYTTARIARTIIKTLNFARQ